MNEYRKNIDSIILELKLYFSEKEREEILTIANLTYDGYVSARVSELIIEFEEFFDTSGHPTDVLPKIDITGENLIMNMFDNGLLQWKTNKGFIPTYDCINPQTGRTLSGILYMTQKCIYKYLDILYLIFIKSFGNPQKDCGNYLTKEEFRNKLIKETT